MLLNSSNNVLLPSFYQSEDVVKISKELLGKVLVSCFDNQITSGVIVETEAYRGPDDKACHAYNNRRTQRTKVMFEAGGKAYVYLCYGIHHLFNVVTAPHGLPHAVLVRAIEPIENTGLMLRRRKHNALSTRLTSGPGILTKAMGITTSLSGTALSRQENGVWIEDRGIEVLSDQIIESPRVGVGYAQECAEWNWRFRVKDSSWTSKAK